MDGVIGSAAAIHLVREGNGPIGGDADAKDQLLQIGAVVLIVATADAGLGEGGCVLSMEGDRGRVVMDAARVDLEMLDDVKRQTEEQAAGMDGNQSIQTACGAVVIDGIFLRRGPSERGGRKRGRPFGDAVKRGGRHQDIGNQKRGI